MTRPRTDNEIASMARDLAKVDWEAWALRLIALRKTNRKTPSTERDGLRAASWEHGAGETCSCDPEDPSVHCPHGTPTERAALAREDRDPLADLERVVTAELVAAHDASGTIRNQWQAHDQKTNARDLNPPPGCEVMAAVDHWEDPVRSVTVDGKTYRVCRWVADFVRDNGVLPNTEQRKAHKVGDRVRVKVDPSNRRRTA